MQISVLQENLHTTLKTAIKMVANKPQIPILGSFLINFSSKELEVLATDLYSGIKISCPIKFEDTTLSICIEAKVFLDLISSFNKGKIELLIDEKNKEIEIISGKTKAKIPFSPPDDYPDFPQITGQEQLISVTNLKQIEKYNFFTVSKDQARLTLTCALFRPQEEELLVVSTDGFRLSTLKIAEKWNLGELLAPTSSLSEVIKIADQENVTDIKMFYSEELKQIMFEIGGIRFFSRVIEGQYPPFEKIIPSGFTTTIEVNSLELLQKIEQALILTRDTSGVVIFDAKNSKLSILSQSSLLGSFEAEIEDATIEGNDIKIAFNGRYLIDLIKSAKPERLIIKTQESLKPALFQEVDNLNFQHIIMPFRLNG